MNLTNKLYETTKKYYLLEDEDGEYLGTYHGTASQYYKKKSGMPLIAYAGKAIATLQFLLKEAQTALVAYRKEEHTYNRNDLMLTHWSNRVIQCEKAIEDLKSYGFYDLIGIIQIGYLGARFSTAQREFSIVDYKTALKSQSDVDGIILKEVSRADYERALMIENEETYQDEKIIARTLTSIYLLVFINCVLCVLAAGGILSFNIVLATTSIIIISIMALEKLMEKHMENIIDI